jgi:DNA topoisomerase-1
LNKKKISIDFENNYSPTYSIISDNAKKTISGLKNAYNKCSDLLIASDEDREGEMIAWSIAYILNIKNSKRITFNSITKKELLESIENPKQIDNNLVDAQKLRRMLDRIIGYKLSPLLWKSMTNNLSAGRVQSVVVKLIIEKENEIKNFFSSDNSSFFKTNGEFNWENNKLIGHLYTSKKQIQEQCDDFNNNDNNNDLKKDKEKFNLAKIKDRSEAEIIMKSISKSEFIVNYVSTRESIRNSLPPFTTSTLQQEASSKFGFTSKRTMLSAQHLYEAGYITYMRTDSVNLSDEAIKIIGNYIKSKYGKDYHKQTKYSSKSKNTQEAHEAIRPTDPKILGISENSDHKISSDEIKLYNLIWKRSIASQMTPAKFDVTTVNIQISKLKDYIFVSTIENNSFLGYLIVYNIPNDKNEVDNLDDNIKINTSDIPKKGIILEPKNIICVESYKNPMVRYGEATLIKKLESLGIGRPSTYSSFIDKIQTINYVKKENIVGFKKDSLIIKWRGYSKTNLEYENKEILLGKEINKFVPTSIGIMVINFLEKYFPNILDYKFTAEMENKLDDIANGNITLFKVIDNFWKEFKPLIDSVDKLIIPKQIINENAKQLGLHPNGNIIFVTIAKYGPVVKMIEKDNNKKITYAPIKDPLTIDNITLENAIELFSFPKNLGKYKNEIVKLNRGKYGLWISVGTIKIPIEIENEKIELFEIDNAIKFIEEKNIQELWQQKDKKYLYTVRDGKFGKYITMESIISKTTKKINIPLPKNINLSLLTLDDVLQIIAKYKQKKFKKQKIDNET